MKNTFFILILFAVLSSCKKEEEAKVEKTEVIETMEQKKLRHVVLFKFKDTSTPEQIAEVEAAFLNLPKEIKEIQNLEWGINNSPEGLNQGLTHCFFLTFASEEARAIYLPHPAHKAFGELLTPHLDKVTVLDYWVK